MFSLECQMWLVAYINHLFRFGVSTDLQKKKKKLFVEIIIAYIFAKTNLSCISPMQRRRIDVLLRLFALLRCQTLLISHRFCFWPRFLPLWYLASICMSRQETDEYGTCSAWNKHSLTPNGLLEIRQWCEILSKFT